jgi:2-oxoglutarate ferredoxin oxidoreductase subunit beta
MKNNLSLASPHQPTWCPGCGNFGLWLALKNALGKLSLTPTNSVAVYGIGCHGNMFNWLPLTSFEGLHGRALPLAQGIKMINPKLTVLAIEGDGDCYGEGGNHLLHACRRNIDLTLLVHNNLVYALTTGQASPSSEKGLKTKSTPLGSFEKALNPLLVSISAGASFVARGFAGDLPFLIELISEAIKHPGFSIVDILQPCVTFNTVNTLDWFRQRVYKLANFDPKNKLAALEKALEWPDTQVDGKIPIGIFFKEEREVFKTDFDLHSKKKTDPGELIKEFL